MHLNNLANTLMEIDLSDQTNVRLYADEEFGMFEKTEIWRRDVRAGRRFVFINRFRYSAVYICAF